MTTYIITSTTEENPIHQTMLKTKDFNRVIKFFKKSKISWSNGDTLLSAGMVKQDQVTYWYEKTED